jgi:hypothetical protein
VYDRQGVFIGIKSIFSPDGQCVLTDWIRHFYDKTGTHLAYCRFLGSDFQHNNGVFITLSPSASDLKQVKGNWITPKNVMAFAIYFAVRLCIDAGWLNDRDQFLFPNDGWKNDAEFQSNCLTFTLFHGQNRIMSRDGVNHWIPFREEEVRAKDCFTSHFMSDWLAGRRAAAVAGRPPYQGELDFSGTTCEHDTQDMSPLSQSSSLPLMSQQARAVLDAGRELWRYYHAQPHANPNASYYDIRLHFQGTTTDAKGKVKMKSESSDATYTSLIANLRAVMKNLAKRIEPKVYEYGFLKG